jgi:aspartyl-tRNA(Asn)/glutamyl-tRNA(Gln) amidotransferase subunit A
MDELLNIDATEAARRVRETDTSAEALTALVLEQAEKTEPSVGAYLAVDADGALEQAKAIDVALADGKPVGPLAGVPVAIKDNIHVRGQATTCASRILDHFVAPYDATVVQRLRDAGAVIIGKTNLDEFAMGSSCELSAFKATRNPWHLGSVPGGSSGGSAAAVAAGSVPLALGSDTGGSIRQPAALCGVVGFKPTYGRVSRYGLVAFASSLDQVGPIARTVGDAALALGVIAGPDPRDSTSARVGPEDFVARLGAGAEGLTVGVIREIDTAALDDDVRSAWTGALERLEAAGARRVEVSVPAVTAAIAVYYVVANCEASANLARFDGVRYGRRAAADRLADLYLESRSRGFGAEVERRIMLGTFALSSGYYDAYYGRARAVMATLRRQLDEALAAVDLLVTPTTPGGAFALGEKLDDPLAMYLSDVFTTPASLAGLPAVAVPAGLDRRGLPLSLQVMGRRFDDATVLRLAAAFERQVGWQPGWEVAPTFAGASGGDPVRQPAAGSGGEAAGGPSGDGPPG